MKAISYIVPSVAGLLALGAACDSARFTVPAAPPGARGAATARVFAEDGTLIDRHADSDGDGISNGDEIDGWIITVDPDGYAQLATVDSALRENLETRQVTSDPRYADTDGDGLSDGDERRTKSDPRRIDTDGDTLSDADEILRWGTSPSSVDTDGDARGGGVGVMRPPLFQLFDGGELHLVPDPAHPDGPPIIGPGATCPFLTDSDGDGVNDYDETLASRRSPTVADVPKLRLMSSPGAVLDLYLNVTTADGKSDSKTYGTSTVIDESGYMRNRTSTEITLENSHYAAIYLTEKADAGCCLNIAKSETEIGGLYDTSLALTQTVTVDLELGMAASANHIRNQAESAEASHAITMHDGTIRMSLDVENVGPVAVRLAHLAIAVRRFDRIASKYVPVTELMPQGDLTLAPRERRTVLLEDDAVPLQAMLDLLSEPQSLAFAAARYDVLDQDGKDFDFTAADVRAASAAIEIDDGLSSDKYWVAAYADKTRGISIGQALGELGIDFEAVPVDADGAPGVEAWKVRIGDRDTEFWTGPALDLHDPLPYTLSGGPGPRLVKRGWYGYVKRLDAAHDDGTFYANLFEAPLYPGDLVTLIYSEDLDRDGLSAAEERILGSSDHTPVSDATPDHPDGDGLSDFWEAREGWTVTWPGRAPYRVFPSPAAIDTDGDGLGDREEAATATDPWMVDTDRDGRSDEVEHEDTHYGMDPLTQQLELPPPTATCTIETRHGGHGGPYYVLLAGGSDAQGDLVALTIDFLDLQAVKPTFATTPVGSLGSQRVFDYCPDPSRLAVTATDVFGSHATTACTWGSHIDGDVVIPYGCEPENEPDGPTWNAYRYE